MNRTLLSIVCLLTLSALAAAQDEKTAAPDARVGKKVIVTVAGAALRTPEATVWKAYLGETFTVSLTNGEWLWIDQKGGWLWEKETIPFDNAIDTLSERIAKEPTAENLHLRGIAYAASDKHNKAIDDYNASLQKKPNDAGVLNNRGQAWYMQQDYTKAVSDFDLAIRADSKHFVAMNNRALCRIAQNNLSQALKDLNAAVALNKSYPEALNNRGVVHAQQGNFKAAISDYTSALAIDPKYVDALGNRAFAFRKQGLIKEAVSDLVAAVNNNPLDYKPVNDLAWLHATTSNAEFRKPKEAVRLATQACEMTLYKDWNPLDTLAAACAATGDFTKAQEWIALAIEQAPDENQASLKSHQKLIVAGKTIPD